MSAVSLEKRSPLGETEFASATQFNQLGRLAPQSAFSGASAAAPAASPPVQKNGFNKQPQVQQQAPAIAPTTGVAAPIYTIGVDHTFKWKNGTDAGAVLEDTPLLAGLQAKGLSTKEQFNVPAMYVESLQNVSHAPLGVQVEALNGRDLKNNFHKDGQWSTVYIPPGTTHNFKSLNDGKGLLIASNPLDEYGNINVLMAPKDLLKHTNTHDDYKDPATGNPTHYVVDVDLSGYGKPGATTSEQLKPMNPLARVVFANAKLAFAQVPGIEEMIGGQLPPLTHDDVHSEKLFDGIKVVPDLTAKERGRFKAVINADQLHDVINHYSTEVAQKAQPTNAAEHKIKVIRIGKKPGEHFGDISRELGVGQAEIDRSKQHWQGLHAKFNYDIQHNGKPFDGEKK